MIYIEISSKNLDIIWICNKIKRLNSLNRKKLNNADKIKEFLLTSKDWRHRVKKNVKKIFDTLPTNT